jgi:pimeloyl-ACP methyl ester carboxylesterase
MLRGLTRESGHWGAFRGQLAEALPSDDVIAVDLPGTGKFLTQTSPRTMGEIFEKVREEVLATHPGAQGRIKLFSISLGSMVAAEWVRQKPEDLKACVVINTSSRRLSPFYNRLRWQVWRSFFRILTIQAVRERERQIIEILFNNEQAREVALPLWAKIAQERPVTYANFFNQMAAASRYDGFQHPTDVPMLILNGLGDRLVDPTCSTEIHKNWGWKIERHPWAGHDLPWDDPEWVINKVVGWNL